MAITNEYTLKISTKQAQKNLDEVNESLKLQEDLVTRLQDELNDLERELAKISVKDANRMKQTKEAIKLKKEEIKEERSGLKQVRADRKKANDQLKQSKKEAQDFSGIMGLVDKQTGGAVSAFSNFTGSVGGATKGLKGFKLVLMSLGIGALIVALTSLASVFTQSEEGQEKLQRGLAAMGAVIKNVMDAFSDLGQAIIDAVTNPMESLKSLGMGLLKFIINPVGTIIDGFEDATEAAKGFIDETLEEVKAIDEVTQARQKAHHIERDLLVERAQANQKINDIRLEAEKRDKYTATERVAMLKQAQKLEEEITNKQIKAKQLLIDAQEKEMAQGKNTIEDKDKLAKLQAELINLDTKRLRGQRLLQTQITTALNQEKAEREQAVKEFTDKYIFLPGMGFVTKESVEKMKADGQAVEDILKGLEEKKREELAITEEQKVLLEQEKSLSELDRLNASEEQKAQVRAYWANEITKAQKKDAKTREEIALQEFVAEKEIQAAKAGLAMQFGSFLQEIAGKNKALAIAGVIVQQAGAIGQIMANTGIANAKAVAATPLTAGQPFVTMNSISAGLSIASAVMSARKSIQQIKSSDTASTITAQQPPTPSMGGGAAAEPVPPAFNIVGASDTNQLADVIGQQTQQPIQAFVVASDVSTAQELDRNIITGASIG